MSLLLVISGLAITGLQAGNLMNAPATAQPPLGASHTGSGKPTLRARIHKSLPLAPGKSKVPKPSKAEALVVSPGGDTLDITGLLESPAHPIDDGGRTSDCSLTAFTYFGAIFSPCGQIKVYDAAYVTGDQQTHLPEPNNSQNVQVWDACGHQVLNDYTSGWYSAYYPYYPRFAGGWTTTSAYITLDNQVCYGTWTQSYTFTQGFTDGQELTATLNSTFLVHLDAPVVTQTIAQSYGGSPIHASQGDPVDSLTGAFNYGPVTDLQLAALGQPLAMTRSYASNSPHDGWFGRGWSSAYDATLQIDGTTGTVTYHDPRGPIQVFTPNGPSGYTRQPGVRAKLVTAGGGGYSMVFKNQTTYSFDSTGRLTDIRDRNGQGPHLTYANGALASISNSGRSLTVTQNGAGHITDITTSDGRQVQYGYDANGELATFTDATGAITHYAYDGDGRLNSIQDANGNFPVRLTYDSVSGRAVSQRDAMGDTTSFGWNQTDATNPGTGQATMTSPRGSVWTDTYTNGYLVNQRDPSGANTGYSWTDDGQMARVRQPDGSTTYFEYDANGNLTSRTLDIGGYYRPSESYTFNNANDVTSTTDFIGNNTTFTYDARGNLATVNKRGPGSGTMVAMVTKVYNADGTLASAKDALNKTTTYSYNISGDLIGVTTPLGRTTTLGRDAAGRLVSSVDPRGNVAGNTQAAYRTTYTYDNDDRITKTVDPLGNTTSTVFDPAGFVSSTKDARGNVTTFTRDAQGRTLTAQGPDLAMGPWRYSYDTDGNLASRTTPRGLVTSFTYDSREHLSSRTTPVGAWTFTYDSNGRQTSQTAPSGRSATMTWATEGLSTITYSDGTPSIQYSYNADGDRTGASVVGNNAAGVFYNYNALHQVTTATVGTDNISYSYDDNGRLTSTSSQSFTYDADGRITSVSDTSGTTATYSYDSATGTVTTTLPSGVVQTQRFDAAGRPIETKSVKGSTVLSRSTYTLDPNGNPTQVVNRDGTTDTYTYDVSNRLTKVCYATATCTGATNYIQWAYDADGNRTQQVTQSGTTTYAYNTSDQITSRAGADGAATYTYDADGNLKTAGATTLTWNGAGQLASTKTGNTTTTFGYDANNHRIATTVGSTKTTRLVDPTNGRLLLERDSRGNTLRQYLYGTSLLGLVSGGARYNYLNDAQGNVRAVTDSTGTAQWTYDYKPFGPSKAVTQGKKPPTNPVQFAGAYNDGSAYLMGARQYLPDLGRFSSQDPIGTGTYEYANDNPMSFTDPSGLSGESWLSTGSSAYAGSPGSYGGAHANCSSAVSCASTYATTAPVATKAQAIAISQEPGVANYAPKVTSSGQVVATAMNDAAGENGLSTGQQIIGYGSAAVVGGASVAIGAGIVYVAAAELGAIGAGTVVGTVVAVTVATGGVATGALIIVGGLVIAGAIGYYVATH